MIAVKHVACIGECMVELVERPDRTLSRGFGGDTLNTAVYLARLGASVDYLTALGSDPFSLDMMQAWRNEGVGTSLVLEVPGALPGLYIIQTDAGGERRFSYWRDSAPARRLLSLPQSSRIFAALPGYDVIYLSGITLSLYAAADLQRLWELLDAARTRGAKIAFDTNFRARGWPELPLAREVYRHILQRADLAFAGVDDLSALFGFNRDSALDFMRTAAPAEIVLKLPTFGCRIIGVDADCLVEPEPVDEVIDTTAAGDSFAAAYLMARSSGASAPAAARAGHRLAATVIRHRGAIIPRQYMPDLRTEA
jgi:2-dehydro-3-deoxygluconokinase